jgi:hypothetical protein
MFVMHAGCSLRTPYMFAGLLYVTTQLFMEVLLAIAAAQV